VCVSERGERKRRRGCAGVLRIDGRVSELKICGFLKINNSIAFFVENKEERGEGRKGRDPR
jgi:hypothetical protein